MAVGPGSRVSGVPPPGATGRAASCMLNDPAPPPARGTATAVGSPAAGRCITTSRNWAGGSPSPISTYPGRDAFHLACPVHRGCRGRPDLTGRSTSCTFTSAPRGRGTPVPRFLGALAFPGVAPDTRDARAAAFPRWSSLCSRPTGAPPTPTWGFPYANGRRSVGTLPTRHEPPAPASWQPADRPDGGAPECRNHQAPRARRFRWKSRLTPSAPISTRPNCRGSSSPFRSGWSSRPAGVRPRYR